MRMTNLDALIVVDVQNAVLTTTEEALAEDA